MTGVSIVGSGITRFGKRNDKNLFELAAESYVDLLKQPGIKDPNSISSDIDAFILSCAQPEQFTGQSHVTNHVLGYLGLKPSFTSRVEMACSSGSVAIRQAIALLKSLMVDLCLVIGAEKMSIDPDATAEGLCIVPDIHFETSQGMAAYVGFALQARYHMNKFGTTEEQMAMVSVKNHYFGSKNPNAHFYRNKILPVTVEKVLLSPVIASPLKLLDCSLISDGAATLLLCRTEDVEKYTSEATRIIASAQSVSNANITVSDSWQSLDAAAREAYKQAAMDHDKVDIVECHDCFTIAEIIEYEGLGFCKKGEGGKLVETGYTRDTVPFNVSGGLKAKGHPVGATGIAQAVEIHRQIQERAGKRQISGVKTGLSHNLSGFGSHHCIHIYSEEK